MSNVELPYPDPIIPLHANACRDCPFPFNVREDSTQPVRIPEIIGIRTSYTMNLPSDLVLTVEGSVPTGGWSGAQISRWFYLLPPADGIMDMDFLAVPPTGNVIQVVLPIHAHLVVPRAGSADFWAEDQPLRGVRIHSTNGPKEFALPPGKDKPLKLDIASDISNS